MSGEPVFVRHGRTRQYVYNSRNPVGRALLVIAPLVAIGVLYSLHSSWHWSEGELRRAVHRAAESLNAKPFPAAFERHHVSAAVTEGSC
ncbi:hypothetical protein [Streptomyces sp. NPDC090022]|uniref:hypothetical protein n=1 Tax=Streptomyces sp. NPDC090022 TaxID=3365920 RepID=UPI003807650B